MIRRGGSRAEVGVAGDRHATPGIVAVGTNEPMLDGVVNVDRVTVQDGDDASMDAVISPPWG